MKPIVFMSYSDVDRILRLLYHGNRPPHIRHLVCICGNVADLHISDAQAIGWQILPHARCPRCLANQPYDGPARDLYLELIEKLLTKKEGDDVHTIIRDGVRDFHRRRVCDHPAGNGAA